MLGVCSQGALVSNRGGLVRGSVASWLAVACVFFSRRALVSCCDSSSRAGVGSAVACPSFGSVPWCSGQSWVRSRFDGSFPCYPPPPVQSLTHVLPYSDSQFYVVCVFVPRTYHGFCY